MFGLFTRKPVVAADDAARVVLALHEELSAERAARGYAMQRMAEMKIEHERELADLRRRLSVAQANFEWLSVSHNRIDIERSELFKTRVGMQMAPMQIGLDHRVMLPDLGAGVPREEVRERPYPDNRTPGVGDLAAQGLSFEDVGDQEAVALGIEGGTVYDTPEALL